MASQGCGDCPGRFDGVPVGLWQRKPCTGGSNGDQLTQLVAPIALYPDTLLAQICAASTDPQQIIDADNWVKQNQGLQGQALQDAALKGGFDPAFVSLVTFPQVLDMMAANIDDYAALGAAFKANQQTVMSAIQTLRQQGLCFRRAGQQRVPDGFGAAGRWHAGGGRAAGESAGGLCSAVSAAAGLCRIEWAEHRGCGCCVAD